MTLPPAPLPQQRPPRAAALVKKGLAALLLVANGLAPLGAQSSLPALGDGSEMTASAERRLGDRIAREIYRDPDYLDDPLLVEYLQAIWQQLMVASRARGELSPELEERFAWEVFLARDRSVNAFALPGGYFGVHLGLIGLVTTRDELASVLGHEMSHVTQRHIARLIARQGQQTPWLIGALILGALAASKNPDAANALILGGQGVAIQNQLNFSRDMEREADRVGYAVMTAAGFEGEGFASMFGKLQQANRINDNGAFPYLRSHPLTTERIADVQARQQLAAPSRRNGPPDLVHPMMAARARVLAAPGVDALRSWVKEAELASNGPAATSKSDALGAHSASQRRVGVLYAAALAAAKLRDGPSARAQANRLTPLVAADADAQRVVQLLQAEIALLSGQPIQALQTLQALPVDSAVAVAGPASAWANGGGAGGGSGGVGGVGGVGGSASNAGSRAGWVAYPTRGRAELMLLAQARLAAPTPAGLGEVAQRLQTWVSVYAKDAQAWTQLSSVQAALGQTVQAARSSAESRAAQLDYPGALDRMKAAQQQLRQLPQRNGNDHIEASIVDQRTRELQAQVNELAREKALER